MISINTLPNNQAKIDCNNLQNICNNPNFDYNKTENFLSALYNISTPANVMDAWFFNAGSNIGIGSGIYSLKGVLSNFSGISGRYTSSGYFFTSGVLNTSFNGVQNNGASLFFVYRPISINSNALFINNNPENSIRVGIQTQTSVTNINLRTSNYKNFNVTTAPTGWRAIGITELPSVTGTVNFFNIYYSGFGGDSQVMGRSDCFLAFGDLYQQAGGLQGAFQGYLGCCVMINNYLTDVQMSGIYNAYKSTLGVGLGLP